MGFSAGGSVVPEVTWKFAFSNGFMYISNLITVNSAVDIQERLEMENVA